MASIDLSSLLSLGFGRSGKRYVLTIGEEYTVLTLVGGARVRNAWIVPADPEEGIAEIRAVLKGDTKTPVMLLADTFEQIYKEEAVPKVGRFDQTKVVRRHAAHAVSGDMWQAAQPQGQDPRGTKLFYLFCGLPRSPKVNQWVAFYEGLPNPNGGIHLLPMESLSLMNALFEGEARAQGGVRWRIMTTMNVTGGLRQIVAKQGRMMLTRLTPAPPDDMEPREAAAMMARDFRQTLTYVKRMGYREGDALDLALIVDPELAGALRETQWEAQSVLVTTPHEVGARLGLGSVGKPEQPYGDVLHAAWFASRRKQALGLARPSEQKADLQKQAEQAAPLAAAAAIAGVLYGGYVTGDALWATWQSIETLSARIPAAVEAQQAALEDHSRLPYDPDIMRGTLTLADELQRGDIGVVALFRSIDAGLKNRAAVRSMDIENGAAPAATPGDEARRTRQEERPTFAWRVDMELTLIEATTAEEALTLSEKLVEDLRAAAPDLKVTMTRAPVAIMPNQTLTGVVSMDALGTGTPTAGLAPAQPVAAEAAGDPATGAPPGFTMRVEMIKEGGAS